MKSQNKAGFQLSPQQKRLWLLGQSVEGAPYFVQCGLAIEGNLNRESLKDAIQTIVNRHEILRTTFRRQPGIRTPFQFISETTTPLWRYIDLSGVETSQQQARIEDAFTSEGNRSSDFENDSPLRLVLISQSANRNILIMTLPAICADSLTMRNLIREVTASYGSDEPLLQEQMQYADYSQWQNDLLESEDEEDELGRGFWLKQHSSSAPALRLPFEGNYDEEHKSATSGRINVNIDDDLIAELGANESAVVSIYLLACWQTLLWRLTGQPEFVVNVESDGRDHEELRGAFGLYAKSLPMRCSFGSDRRFDKVVELVREALDSAYEWQALFNPLKDAASPETVGFAFYDELSKQEVKGLTFSIIKQYASTYHSRLRLCCVRSESSVGAELHYDPALFQRATIERIARHFKILLESAARRPEAPVSQLALLDEAELRKLLVEFNETRSAYPDDKCIHELFEQQVGKTPSATALVFDDQHLSYGELNARANRLAHLLLRRGLAANVPVGLCVERSLEMIVGLLGILKAGCAYVPLNPEHPKTRLLTQLSDARAPVVVTQEKLAPQLPDFDGEVICLDNQQLFEGEATTNPSPATTPDSLVYVLYTSGSTGTPKGVAVRHRNLVNYTHFICERLNLKESGGLQFASVSTITADLGNTCIFPSLVTGGCLHIVKYEVAMEGSKFADYLKKHPIDVVKIVPSHLSSLLDTAGGENCLPRKYLVLGGDILSWELAERVSRMNDHCEVINHYGPTETTVGSLTFGIREREALAAPTAHVPIGRPISNTQIYILDGELKPVPIGVAGQLCISGAGVAQGYLNQPEETAKRFIANPYSAEAAGRLYLTGDLARYVPDGNVEFLGRIDNQVKIRGYRVELEEIETMLRQHPQVKQAVVVSRGDGPAEKKLVAYVVAARGQSPTVSDLRGHLSDQLPDYMVPASYVFLNALPLTSNGKIDRGALPEADVLRPELDRGYMAPRTPVEEILAGIWAKLLKLDHVGVHDSFFELGGHSLLATQVISRIRETLQVDLPLSSLFEAPTVAGLTQAVEERRRASQGVQAPPISRALRKAELPLSFAQQRLWLLDQLEPGNVNYNVPRAIRLRGHLNHGALKLTLESLVSRHESLRTTFAVVDGRPRQVIANSGSISLPSVDLSRLPELRRLEEIERATSDEAQQPFDLTRGPLLRATLLRLDDEDHILLLTNHHIVSDGWSGGILFQEFAILYSAFSTGQPSPLEELPLQYADYAIWQREQLQGEVLEQQLNYWKQQLEGAPPLLDLPLDRPRPPVQTHRGESKSLLLPVNLVKELKDLSQREGATLFMTLLAAFQLLLSRQSGQEDISVGSPIAGRTHAEIERLIGFFVNTLVLRTRLSGDPTFRELLVRVREIALGAFANQEIPFEKLIEELQPERSLSHQPLFQVFFNMQNLNMLNFSGNRIELPGLAVEHLPSSEIGSKFDLTLYAIERADELQLELLYDADLFKPERMAEMLDQFKQLLEDAVQDPDNRISNFSLVTPSSKQLLPDPTQALRAASSAPIQKLFSQQARQTPAHPAVVDKKISWSYHELDARSNQLANYLRANGIGSEDIVAVYARRSASLVMALLGVLKAGAAFLILDPAYPVTRIVSCLRMASPRGWLQIEGEDPLPKALDEFVNTLDCRCRVELTSAGIDDRGLLSGYSTEDPQAPVHADDLAYLAFTSGSTGTPKGIVGRHQSLPHFGNWAQEMFGLGSSDRFSMLSGLSHDPLHRDIFTALQLGATISVPDSEDLKDPRSLRAWMNQQEISVANLTPAMAQLMTETSETDTGEIQSLRYAFLVGDVLTKRDVARMRRFAPSLACVNLYGATETHFALGHYVAPQTRTSFDGKEVLPLGKGIKDVQLILLNGAQGMAGIGEVGEICFRSPYLTRGYLGDDELTRERFLLNPFTKTDGDRLYRTGDLGRYLPDGNVEFLGRSDRQVQIRGFRIELGEVEAALVEHAEVRETAVIIREKDLGEKFLAAYVVRVQKSEVTTAELRSHLRERLPDYMIPAAFVMMEALPLTPNGKVDHAALPAPDTSLSSMERTFVAPQTPAEEVIAAIWEKLLGLEKVSVNDNFFDLGGHSLLATQVISRVRDSFQLELPLRALFESPTVAGLALTVVQRQATNAEPDDLKDILAELSELSDEESQHMLNTEMQ